MATFRSYTKADGSLSVTARVRISGVERTATFSTGTAAKAWARKTEVELKEHPHLHSGEAQKRTLAEVVDRYLLHVLPQRSASMQRDQTRMALT